MNIHEQTFANEDKAGNKLFLKVFFNDKNEKLNAKIAIKLASESRPRQMGTYDFRSRTFYCQRKSEKHYHRMTKGYAVNWTLMEDPYLAIEKIHMVIDDSNHYEFSKSIVQEYGKFLNFKQQGFELQRFVPFEIIKRYHVPNNPDSNNNQDANKPEDGK